MNLEKELGTTVNRGTTETTERTYDPTEKLGKLQKELMTQQGNYRNCRTEQLMIQKGNK